MHATTRRRPLALALVLALLWSSALTAVAPPAAEALTTRPAPDDPLPPCRVVDGREVGACEGADRVAVAANGRLGAPGAKATVVVSPGVPVCVSWPNRAAWNPSPCWTTVSYSIGSPVTLSEDGADLVPAPHVFMDGSYAIAESSLNFRRFTGETFPSAACGRATPDFDTYIYGGHQVHAPWSSMSRLAVTCDLTWEGGRPDNLRGATWIPIEVSLGMQANGDRPPSPTARTWVRVDGDMPNPGPDASFTVEPVQGLQHQATDTSSHPWDLPLTHEWFVDGTSVSTAASPLLDLQPGDNTVSLVVTDSDGLVDRASEEVRVPDGSLDVSVGRTDTEPLRAGDTFDVMVRVALPFDAPEDVTGVNPRGGAVLQLPPWLEVVSGAMPTGFDLTPGSERSATFTLQATGPGGGEITSTWTGQVAEGTVAGTGSAPVSAAGAMRGEWFRTDGLGDLVREGEEVAVRLRVENRTGQDLTEVRLVEAEVVGADAGDQGDGGGGGVIIPGPGEGGGRATLTGPSNALRGTLGTGPASVDFLDFRLKGEEAGTVELRAVFEGRAPDGSVVTGHADAEWQVRAVAMTVEVVLPDEPVALEPKVDGERDETGQLVDPGFEPAVVPIILRVTVAEDDDTVTDVKPFEVVAGDAGLDVDVVTPVDGGWQELAEQPVPFPASWSPATPSSIPEIAPGTSADFTVDLTVERPGAYEIASIVEGVVGDATARATGDGVLEVGGEEILRLAIQADRDQGNPPRIDEGDVAHFTGEVENLSLTDTLELAPLRVVPLGQGVPFGPVELTEAFPEIGSFAIFDPTLEPGERVSFKIKVETTSLPGLEWEPLVTGRESVVLDLLAGGELVSPDGERTDLTREQVLYEVGNGRHEPEDGVEVVRVQVEPRLDPFPPTTFKEVANSLVGASLEGLALGGRDFLVSLPQLVAALPGVLLTVGEAGIDTTTYLGEYALTVHKYAWRWLDYQTDVWLELPSSEHRKLLDEIAAELSALHDKPVEEVKPLVDKAVTDMFTGLLGWYEDVNEAGAVGNLEALEQHTRTATRITTQTLAEEITGEALFSWLAKSRKAFDGPLDEANTRAGVDAPRDVEAGTAKMKADDIDPRTLSDRTTPRRAFRAGTPVSPLQAIRGWAIDAVSDSNLRKLTSPPDGLPIVVAIRSRADETLEWMRDRIGVTPKPVTVKAKNVDQWDVEYLDYRGGVGYREGPDGTLVSVGDRGSVALAEPISRDEVVRRLLAGGADDYVVDEVLKRHAARWKEWYGVECPKTAAICTPPSPPISSDFTKLTDGAVRVVNPDGTITYKGALDVPQKGTPPEPKDNFDTAYDRNDPRYPGQFDPRAFELRGVKTPDGREYYEMWLTDADGVLKRVSGDIDVVSVTRTDGRSLEPNSSFARYVAQELQDNIDGQHPWSTSLINPQLRAKFVDPHRWHPDPRRRGEPLLVYVNGEARVGWFDQARFVPINSATSEVRWLQGGLDDLEAVVEQQHRLNNSLTDPFLVDVDPLKRPAGKEIRRALIEADASDGTNHFATCSISTVRSGAAIFRMGTRLEQRQQDGTWAPADPAAVCAAEGRVTVLPETFTLAALTAGTTIVEILEELLPFDWRELFLPGDCVTISPGEPNEERACIEAQGSLVLTAPLRNSHPLGARIVLDPAIDDGGGGSPPGPDVCDSDVLDAVRDRTGDGPDDDRQDLDLSLALLEASTVDCVLAEHDGPVTVLVPKDVGWVRWARERGLASWDEADALAFALDRLVSGDGDTSALDALLLGQVMEGRQWSSRLRDATVPTLLDGRSLRWIRMRVLDGRPDVPDPRLSRPRNVRAGDDLVHVTGRVVPVD